jgi:hypothetical protein
MMIKGKAPDRTHQKYLLMVPLLQVAFILFLVFSSERRTAKE